MDISTMRHKALKHMAVLGVIMFSTFCCLQIEAANPRDNLLVNGAFHTANYIDETLQEYGLTVEEGAPSPIGQNGPENTWDAWTNVVRHALAPLLGDGGDGAKPVSPSDAVRMMKSQGKNPRGSVESSETLVAEATNHSPSTSATKTRPKSIVNNDHEQPAQLHAKTESLATGGGGHVRRMLQVEGEHDVALELIDVRRMMEEDNMEIKKYLETFDTPIRPQEIPLAVERRMQFDEDWDETQPFRITDACFPGVTYAKQRTFLCREVNSTNPQFPSTKNETTGDPMCIVPNRCYEYNSTLPMSTGTFAIVNSTCEKVLCQNSTGHVFENSWVDTAGRCRIRGWYCDNCTAVRLPCENCTFVESTPCANCSFFEVRTNACACPLDRYGIWCETSVPFRCNNTIISPKTECTVEKTNRYDPKMDGDPPCVVVERDSTVELTFELDCKFTGENPNYELYDIATGSLPNIGYDNSTINFSYWTYRPFMNFSASVSYNMSRYRLKAWDFNHLSREDLSQYVALTPYHYAQMDTINFSLDLKTVPDDILYGGRLYLEGVLVPQFGMADGYKYLWYDNELPAASVWLDLKGVGEPGKATRINVGLILFILFLLLGLFLGGAYYLRRRDQKRQKERRREEKELHGKDE